MYLLSDFAAVARHTFRKPAVRSVPVHATVQPLQTPVDFQFMPFDACFLSQRRMAVTHKHVISQVKLSRVDTSISSNLTE